jgi:hypothetical protein
MFIEILAIMTQVSDVALGPLVKNMFENNVTFNLYFEDA